METTDLLRKLIRACVDDWRTLRHESKFVDGTRAETLARLAHEREEFVADLERVAGREQPHDGSWSELSREVERDVRVAVAGRDASDAIASCRHSRARTEATYDDALEASWPEETQRMLTAQRGRLHDEADELIHLQF